jgi:hypothetical protein
MVDASGGSMFLAERRIFRRIGSPQAMPIARIDETRLSPQTINDQRSTAIALARSWMGWGSARLGSRSSAFCGIPAAVPIHNMAGFWER